MDVNGLRFWTLQQPSDWLSPGDRSAVALGLTTANGLLGSDGLIASPVTGRLHLLSTFSFPNGQPDENASVASSLVEIAPMACDVYGTYARWDAASAHVVAGGCGLGEVPIFAAAPSTTVTDLVLGEDDVLYIASGGVLVLVDRRGRWPAYTVAPKGFAFWRLAALSGGGVLALDRSAKQLGKVTGAPLPAWPVDPAAPGILRSCDPNADPPRLSATYALGLGNETCVALCALDGSTFALLTWNQTTPAGAFVRTFSQTQGLGSPITLGEIAYPYTMAAAGATQLAVLITGFNEAVVFDLESASAGAVPAGDSYVLASPNLGPFAHAPAVPARYPNPQWFATPPPAWAPQTAYPLGASVLDPNADIQNVQTAGASGSVPPAWNAAPGQATSDASVTWTNAGALTPHLPLLPLSLNSFASSGATAANAPAICDGGTAQTVWHRLFVEAIVPPACGVIVWLAASDSAASLATSATLWYPHVLGTPDLSQIGSDLQAALPRLVWQSEATEIPFGPALLGVVPVRDRAGLFGALIQRANKAVRSLSGRYLGVRIDLFGNGRATPEIAALRAYASRFSYVAQYLPELYHERAYGAAADRNGSSTRHDFLERFVDLFEAQLTRIEDRVANAYLLTRPEATPDAALDWLGSWVGVDATDGFPPDRRRARLLALPELYAERGTAAGISATLDVAANGLCSTGAIIVLEAYRLRHLFATILGAHLADTNDPLLPGFAASSNSFVGAALFLGDPRIAAELQALYQSDLGLAGSAAATDAFYDQFANRLTVFVHEATASTDLALVKRIVEAEKPAHVQASVVRASRPLMIGLASLVGVNTFLEPETTAGAATLGQSDVGRYDVITHMPSLDPRLGGAPDAAQWQTPIARIVAPSHVAAGASIVLDGSASSAAPGGEIVAYRWSLLSVNGGT